MSFAKPKDFKPSTKKQLKRYARRAREKETMKPKKIERESSMAHMLKQVNFKAFRNLLKIGFSSTVQKRTGSLLSAYSAKLIEKHRNQSAMLAKDPKSKFLTPIKVPELDPSQSKQFCYELEGLWAAFGFEDNLELLKTAIGKEAKISEPTTAAELAKRALRQVLGIVYSKKGFDLANPKATLKIWEPLRSETMKKMKKAAKNINLDSSDAESPKLSKKKERRKMVAVEEPKPKKKLNAKPEKENGKRSRLPNLADDNVLKPKKGHSYKKGMGEVFGLIPKEGITVKKFYSLAAKKKMDAQRTQIYLSVMRRNGTVTVH